jgi:hypothetical protein
LAFSMAIVFKVRAHSHANCLPSPRTRAHRGPTLGSAAGPPRGRYLAHCMQGCREWGGHATRGDPTAARWQATSIGLQDPGPRWCHDVCRTMPGPRRWQGNQAPRRPPCRHWPAEQPCRQNTGVLGVRGGVSCWALPHHGGWWWWSGRGRPPVGWVHAKKNWCRTGRKKEKRRVPYPQ